MKKTLAVLAVCLAATFGTTQNASAQGAAVGSLGGLSAGAAVGVLAALLVVVAAAGGGSDAVASSTTTTN